MSFKEQKAKYELVEQEAEYELRNRRPSTSSGTGGRARPRGTGGRVGARGPYLKFLSPNKALYKPLFFLNGHRGGESPHLNILLKVAIMPSV